MVENKPQIQVKPSQLCMYDVGVQPAGCVRRVDRLETTHVVVGFEGFNLPLFENAGDQIASDKTDNRVVAILTQGTKDVDNVVWRGYSTDMGEKADIKAESFITENLRVSKGRQLGKLIIYGYSMGGDTAVELCKRLQGHYTVDLLITVDTATAFDLGVDRVIPENVRKNLNYMAMLTIHDKERHGAENKAENKATTIVDNIPYPNDSHATIYKTTKIDAINEIRAALRSKKLSTVAEPIHLYFDGAMLKVISKNNGLPIMELPAISGLPAHAPHLLDLIKEGRKDLDENVDYRAPEYQNVKDAGPIPEGTYSLMLTATMNYDKSASGGDGAGWGDGGWRLQESFWGKLDNIVGGRQRFFLHHDGGNPGTAGCIGLKNSPDLSQLRKRLILTFNNGDKDDVVVIVKYPTAK